MKLENVLGPVPSPDGIRAIRKAAGITQVVAAARIGLSSNSKIADWEGGHSRPAKTTFTLYSLILGVHPDYVLTPRDDATESPVLRDLVSGKRTPDTIDRAGPALRALGGL